MTKKKTTEKVEKVKEIKKTKNEDKIEIIADAAGNQEKKITHPDGTVDIVEV